MAIVGDSGAPEAIVGSPVVQMIRQSSMAACTYSTKFNGGVDREPGGQGCGGSVAFDVALDVAGASGRSNARPEDAASDNAQLVMRCP